MQSGKRRRKWLLRWAEVGIVVIGLSVIQSTTWAGSVDQQTGTSGTEQPDGDSCIETVQDWLEDSDGHFIDWNGHGKCRLESGRVKAPKPETIVSETVKDLEAWLLSVLGVAEDRK